ncbi:MAG TPA: universal stress protein [Gammaproteobacteria bacterium]|nr:universal stress protein [Gammaproteobacteria bacterium]
MFQNILLLVTEDSNASAALTQVLRLASLPSGANPRLTLLTVAEPVPEEARATMPPQLIDEIVAAVAAERRERVEAVAEQAKHAGLPVETRTRTGATDRVAVREVLLGGHDLLIKTAEPVGGSFRAPRLSVDKQLLRNCPCPVWLVREDGEVPLRKVLAAVDPDPSVPSEPAFSAKILETAATLAALDGAALHVLHAWRVFGEVLLRRPRPLVSDPEVDYIVGGALNRHVALVDALVEKTPLAGVTPEKHVVHQNPAHAIIDFVEREAVDLLVLGTVARTGVAGFLIGNTAERVLDEVTCSVIALKPAGFVSPVRPEETA